MCRGPLLVVAVTVQMCWSHRARLAAPLAGAGLHGVFGSGRHWEGSARLLLSAPPLEACFMLNPLGGWLPGDPKQQRLPC